MFLRRRGDLDLVMAQLGGDLFATEGEVDSYFNLNHCCDKFEDGTGRVFVCDLIKGHVGAHEDESMEWWNEENPAIKIHPEFVSGKSWPIERDVEEEKRIIDETISWWQKRCTPELIHRRLVARNPKMDGESLRKIQESMESHIRSAPEREAAQLRQWAVGYDDGIRTALAILKRDENL